MIKATRFLLAAAFALLAPAAVQAQACARLNFDAQTKPFVSRGGPLVYKLTVTNYGSNTLSDYMVDLVVPPVLTVRSVSRGSTGAKSLSKANNGFTYTVSVPSIEAGKTKTLMVKFVLAECAPVEFVAITASGHRAGSDACPGSVPNVHVKVKGGLSSKCPAVPGATPPQGFNSWQALANLYDAYPQSYDVTESYETGISCTVPYALCAYAQCRIVSTDTDPPLAECGCYGYTNPPAGEDAEGLSAQSLLLSTQAQNENIACKTNPTSCQAYNVAPACAAFNISATQPRPTIYSSAFQLISTYNFYTWPDAEIASDPVCSSGQFANCCTAGCFLRESYNGYNTTCYCPVYNIQKNDKTKFFVGSGDCGTVNAPIGSTLYSGMSLFQNPN